MGQTRPLFVYFRPFLNTMTNTTQNLTIKSVDGVLWTQTRGGRMVGTDESTELWLHPFTNLFGCVWAMRSILGDDHIFWLKHNIYAQLSEKTD